MLHMPFQSRLIIFSHYLIADMNSMILQEELFDFLAANNSDANSMEVK